MAFDEGNLQHLDVEIPRIEIAPGWYADAVSSEEECDRAHAFLTAACAVIERDLDLLAARNADTQEDLEWEARAKCALKFKKGAMAIVQRVGGRLKRAAEIEQKKRYETAMLRIIRKEVDSAQYNQWATKAGDEIHPTAHSIRTEEGK